jgi:alpha-mannosidase
MALITCAGDGDGLILRCFNPSGTATSARVVGEVTVSRTRLDETGARPVPDGRFELQPGEIGTLRLSV